MKIGGFQPFALSDFPGRVAAVIFVQGCNFQCPFCHNGPLIPPYPPSGDLVSLKLVTEFLALRADKLDGVVISGGEPLLQPDLEEFLKELKYSGLDVKIDTNGSRPDVLGKLIGEGLVDYIAMDIKAPLELYARLAGVKVDEGKILQSIHLIAGSGVPHEFRTTNVESLLSTRDIEKIRSLIPDGSSYRIQKFRKETAMEGLPR